MTLQEMYEKIGNYEEATVRLMNERIIAKFIVKFPEDPTFGQLMEGWEAKDPEAIFQAAHTLKGVCGNLALTPLYDLVADLVEHFRGYQERTISISEAVPMMEAIVEQYEKTVEGIQQYKAL